MQLDVHTLIAHPLDVVLNQQKMTFFVPELRLRQRKKSYQDRNKTGNNGRDTGTGPEKT
jgi:hypothetical protein